MDATRIVLFLIFGLGLAWYSYLVWFKPGALLKWTKAYGRACFDSRWVVFQKEYTVIS